MPAPIVNPIPTGVDSSGGYGVPGSDLAVAGRQEQSRTERLDQLRSLMATAGSTVVGVVQNEAAIAQLAKSRAAERRANSEALYRQVQQQKEDADNEAQKAYRSSMRDRLTNVERSQFDILRDPRSENHEWVLNEAVMRQNNAGYPEERDGWNDFIIRHQEASRNDAKRQAELTTKVANAGIINDRRIAAKTAKNAVDDLWNDIQLDSDLQGKLIGDGKGINQRVDEHVLQTAIAAAPQLFNLDKKDPQYSIKMEQQTILLDELENRAQQTIVDPLTKQYISNTHKSMEETGSNRIEVAAQSFAEGGLSADEYHDVVGDTLRVNFAHVDPRQRDNIRQKLYQQQFERLSKLIDQPDPGKALQKMEDLLGVADLNANEKQIIREQIISDKFPKAVLDRTKSLFQQKAAEMSGITRLSDGKVVVPRDPKTIAIDMLENGNYRDIGGQVLDQLGIRADKPLTALQGNLLGVVTDAIGDAEDKARQYQATAVKSVERASRFLSGAALNSSESAEQWEEGALMRLLSGKMSVDDPVLQSITNTYTEKSGKSLEWDGKGPFPINQETLPILRDVALQEGQAWGRNSITSIPSNLSKTIESMVLYESPDRAEVALNFWQGLGIEGQQRLGQSMDARSSMVLTEASRLYGQDVVGRGLSMPEIVNRVRTIDQNTAVAALRTAKEQAGLFDLTPNPGFIFDYAKSLSKVLGESVMQDAYGSEVTGFDIDVPDSGFNGSKAVQGLSSTFGSAAALQPLFAQMALVQQANPGTTLDQAAMVVGCRMRQQGFKVVSGTLGKQIVKDQWNHYPTDLTPSDILRQSLAQPMKESEARSFISRMSEVGPETQKMVRDGVLPADILWSHLSEQSKKSGGENIPHPSEWAFTPESNGPLFEGLMSQEDGGVPMQVTIPGFGRTQMLIDARGNPLLIASARRRAVTPNPVDRAAIPDYFLTPHGRAKIPLRPDSSGKIADMLAPVMGQDVR